MTGGRHIKYTSQEPIAKIGHGFDKLVCAITDWLPSTAPSYSPHDSIPLRHSIKTISVVRRVKVENLDARVCEPTAATHDGSTHQLVDIILVTFCGLCELALAKEVFHYVPRISNDIPACQCHSDLASGRRMIPVARQGRI